MVVHTGWGAWQSPNPSTFPAWWERSSFAGLVPSDDMVDFESAVGFKPGDSSVVIGNQVDEFTHTWSVEQFVVCSNIYAGLCKVSSLTDFPLEDFSFLNKAVADCEQGLDAILTGSIKTPELKLAFG